MTQDYYGTKRVTAWPAPTENGEEGYGVKYADGYVSWSPKAAFEEAYQPITGMSFGHAITAKKEGHRVTRQGWNGKGMFLCLIQDWSPCGPIPCGFDWESTAQGAFICMKTATDEFVPWLASQTDMLADDWALVE